MSCNAKKLAQLALSILDEADTKTVETHVATCPSCTQRLAELRRTVALLEEVPGTDNEPMDMDRLHAMIADRKPVAGRFGLISERIVPRWRWALALAAAACLAVLCFRYGVAVRVGQFEVAFGGAAVAASTSKESAVPDDLAMRQIARQEIARGVVPTLVGLARQIGEMDTRNRDEIMAVRADFAEQRVLDQGELRRNFRLMADSMIEAVRGSQ
jgi:anti-sigma factor RsiW